MHKKISEIVKTLDLAPHPEGGFFKEVYRSEQKVFNNKSETRSLATAIYFLLPGETFSSFHKVKGSDEIWHYYAGASLELHIINQEGTYGRKLLGTNFDEESHVHIVPADSYQAARSLGEWTLVGCTVHPGFDFEDFEMPTKMELTDKFPEHTKIIEKYTKC